MLLQAEVAARYAQPLVAYEGGQHLVGVGSAEGDPALNALFDAANRDPRMGRLYDRYLADWNEVGGGVFVNFGLCGNYTRHGRWGMVEYLGQPRAEAPKYDAILRYLVR